MNGRSVHPDGRMAPAPGVPQRRNCREGACRAASRRAFPAGDRASEAGITDVSEEVMARLVNYDWPGNVRELENCIQRALALGSAPQIRVVDLPSSLLYFVGQQAREPAVLATLRELEQRQILQALEATKGDRQRAAKLLGIGKTTIYRKIKEYGLEDAVDPTSAG